jgi:hypothetical protein
MRRILVTTMVLMTIAALAPMTGAELLTKSYVYKDDIKLELGVASGDGLRIDSVRFRTSSGSGGMLRTGDRMAAEVSVSNTSSQPLKVGLAIALYDDGERLLGVASAGTRLVPIKSGRQKRYILLFSHVNAEAPKATTFQISMESKR